MTNTEVKTYPKLDDGNHVYSTRDLSDKFNVDAALFLVIQYFTQQEISFVNKGLTLRDDIYNQFGYHRDSLHYQPEILAIPINLFDQACMTYKMAEVPKHFFDTVYTNYRGETDRRSVFPIEINFKSTEYHNEEQYILTGIDLDRMVIRDFAVKDFKSILFQPIKENEL
jgi:hypothetical protein